MKVNTLYKPLALAAAFALFGASERAEAIIIVEGGVSYDVTATPVTLLTNVDVLRAVMETPWWGDTDAAQSAADQVGIGLGLPNISPFYSSAGPAFVYGIGTGASPSLDFWIYVDGDAAARQVSFPSTPARHVYAILSDPVPTPAGGTTAVMLGLGLIGVGAVKRKQRS